MSNRLIPQQWRDHHRKTTAKDAAPRNGREVVETIITALVDLDERLTAVEAAENDRRFEHCKTIIDARASPGLKQQALSALRAIASGANDMREQYQDLELIQRALQQLPDD